MVDLKNLKIEQSFKDKQGDTYIVASISNRGEVECVQLDNADNIIHCSAEVFKEKFTPLEENFSLVVANEDYNIHKDSPLSSALIKTSRIVATLNALLRVTLRAAPPDVKTAAVNAIGATKALLQKLVEEVRED
jgi:hypothetical protein